MPALIILLLAIAAEVFGSTMLKKSEGFKKFLPTIGFVVGYLLSFYGLAMALAKIPLGIAYTVWSGVGTACTVLVGIILFREKASKNVIIGVSLVLLGVVLLNIEKV